MRPKRLVMVGYYIRWKTCSFLSIESYEGTAYTIPLGQMFMSLYGGVRCYSVCG